MSVETSRPRQARKLRAELEHLEGQRQKLAEQRTDAMRATVWHKAIVDEKTAELAAIYKDFREARAGFEAGGGTGAVTRRRRDVITSVTEIVADPLGVFVRQCCLLRSDAMTQTVDLKTSYGRWAAVAGAEPMSPHAITKRLVRMRGVSLYRSHGRRLYRGVEVLNIDPMVEGDTFGDETAPVRILEVK
jgi:hypothetical protein